MLKRPSSGGYRKHKDVEVFETLKQSNFDPVQKLGYCKSRTPGCSPIRFKTPKILEKNQVKVRADEAKYDELGMVNFYGYVSKRRADMNKFHDRWMVLRGQELYWYRNVGDQQQKGINILPARPILHDFNVGGQRCFVI